MSLKAEFESVKINSPVNDSKIVEEITQPVIKGQDIFKQKQNEISLSIKNTNIEKHIKDRTEKLIPPPCLNCPKRRADRVCTNKECGPAKYLQIICGKCHADIHASAQKQPEIDIEEFFIKLSIFFDEQKCLPEFKNSSSINLEHLNLVFGDLNKIRQQLTSIKSKIKSDVQGYRSPQEIHSLLQGSITKALSLCEYQNIQEQLNSIKQSVLFDTNKFIWNDVNQKYRQYTNTFRQFEQSEVEAWKTITKSFVGKFQICLDDLKMVYYPEIPSLELNQLRYELKPSEGVFKIAQQGEYELIQYYLDYKLDQDKKYKLRIQFTQNPRYYVMIGIMPLAKAHIEYVYNVQNEFFCKRFFSSEPNNECGRIIKGANLGYFPKEGTQIEMRIDLKNSYMDFSDYPYHNNINANHTHFKLQSKEQYVIAILVNQNQTVTVESFEEISSIEEY